MNIWVVKCTGLPEGDPGWEDDPGWHWERYFKGKDGKINEPFGFGGDDWIRHNASMQRIRDEIAPGDIVVCYQTNPREILGLTRFGSVGQQDERSGRFNVFDLEPADQAFVFDAPIQIVRDLYDNGIYPRCFSAGTHGTLFPVTGKDFLEIVDAIQQKLPEQQHTLKAWLARNG